MIGTRMVIPASEVRPDDFTTFSGFRRVLSVAKTSSGLCATGSKVWGKRVAFARTGQEGDSPRIDRVSVDARITVYRQEGDAD